MDFKEIIDILVNNVPEIIVILCVSPLQVLLVEFLKKWVPFIKKNKNGIFTATLFSSGLITFSIALPGWISVKSSLAVFLAITVMSKIIYDFIKKIIKVKVGGANE